MRTSDARYAMPPPAPEPAGVVGADQLFREHAAYVAAFLRRLGIRDASVDDAVQEVFLVAHLRGGYQPGPASARSWLGAIAIRVAANARRAARRDRGTEDERTLVVSSSPSVAPDAIVEHRQELALVGRALDDMNDAHRQAFLSAVEGHSCTDIALSSGVPTGTVYSRLHAARSSLAASREIAAPISISI